MGATAYTEAIAEKLAPSVHATTFGGNPLVCAAGVATLDVLERDDLPARAATLGARLLEEIRAALEGITRVRAVRGRGLMLGIELREKAGPYLAALLREHRILTLPAGPNVIRLLPPLIVEEADLERAVAALVEVLR
jgi:acetylornithine/LysW-gamma-L-lysine aminotransferase